MKTKLTLLALTLLLSSCADTLEIQHTLDPVGFWYGLWHGMILPFAFIVSLFDSDVAIYAIYNSGGWYDFGFWLGIGTTIGTSSRNTYRH